MVQQLVWLKREHYIRPYLKAYTIPVSFIPGPINPVPLICEIFRSKKLHFISIMNTTKNLLCYASHIALLISVHS